MESQHWHKTELGRWERDVDEAEQFYTSLTKSFEGSGRNFFAITGFISLSVAVPQDSTTTIIEERVTDALRKAWLSLRYHHPTIGAWVEYDEHQKKCRKVYEPLNDKDEHAQRAWLADTFRAVSTGQTGLEWCNSDPPVPPLPTLFVVTPPHSADQKERVVRRDLVLRCHHDIIDGMGTLLLFNNFFAHASRAYSLQSSYQLPTFGSEWKNLSPSFRVATGVTQPPTPEQKARLDETVKHNASLRQDVEIASVSFKRGVAMPGKHQRVARTLSEHRSSLQLLQACKDLGVTVTHAYHAAIAMCVRDLQERGPEERSVRYINYCLINERRHCKEPFNSPEHAVAVFHSVSGKSLVIDLTVPAATDAEADVALRRREEFRKIVLDVKDFYHSIRDDAEHVPMVPLYWSLASRPYPEDGSTPPVPEPNPSPSVSISSMGCVDSIISPSHGPFELGDPWVTGEELGTGLGLFLGTFRGQLNLSAAYNDAWHEKDGVLEFLNDCEDVVFDGLGL